MATVVDRPEISPAERKVRRAILAFVVIAALVTVAVAAPIRYFSGGGRLRLGGSMSGPVELGLELHFLLGLRPTQGSIELRSVDVELTGNADVSVRLVRLGEGASDGSTSGPLPEAYQEVPLRGQKIPEGDQQVPEGDAPRYALDLRLTADELGETNVDRIEVTYEAGRFRTRTAVTDPDLCVVGVESIADYVETPRPPFTGPCPIFPRD